MASLIQWFNTNSGAIQGISGVLALCVTIILTRTSIRISKKQKDIAENLFTVGQIRDKEMMKRVSLLIQLKFLEVEKAVHDWMGQQRNNYIMYSLDLDLGISHEVILMNFDTYLYQEFLVTWRKIEKFKGYFYYQDAVQSYYAYANEETLLSEKEFILEHIKELTPKLQMIAVLDTK